KFTVALNAQLEDGERFFFSPRYVTDQNADNNSATNRFAKRFSYDAQPYLNYAKSFNEDSNFSFAVAAASDRARFSEVFLSGTNFVLENGQTITGANITDLSAQRVTRSAVLTVSYFARANYSYKGRYHLSGVIRI